jgi:Xaa-Pro aminopeptidase
MKIDYNARCKRLLGELEGNAVDAFFLADLPNVRYYTGFSGSQGFTLIDPGGGCLVTDARYRLQAAQEATQTEVVIYERSIYATLAELCSARGLERIGFDPANLTCALLSALRKGLKGRARLVAVKGKVSRPRLVKDAGEIERIRKAVHISEAALKTLLERDDLLMLRERDVAAEMEAEMRRRGAEDRAFPTIAVSGTRSALPHGRSTSSRLREGTVLLIDWGAEYQGYNADLTRTIRLGRLRGRLGKVCTAVLESRERVLEAMRPGVRVSELDRLSRTVIEQAGFGAGIAHSLGHGVGLEVHEPPFLSLNSREMLREGMVFTLEPGVYLPGLGGIRVEDVIRLGEDGPHLLSSLPAVMEYN